MKCTAILENFFFKSASLVVVREGTEGRGVLEQGGLEQEGKLLGLFDEDSYREAREGDGVRTAWTSSPSTVTRTHILLLLLPLIQPMASLLAPFSSQ